MRRDLIGVWTAGVSERTVQIKPKGQNMKTRLSLLVSVFQSAPGRYNITSTRIQI